ncbi:hypothetical protein QFZ66_008530 [Streptomyces sp. B4I13]|uniref:hypothetical protein n=1 Tax=Streptomyces sp. B4I13 TaxID=3042271 RepID=UPI0027850300|nr:hypothetical protein [Streptomyces sp. B4I13]MDQ0964562.1 hypothetical protein [Streptomyces sp. B4I13]
MTSTHGQVTARLRNLLEDLESGTWSPSRAEQTCAAAVLDTVPGTPPVDALLAGMRTAGPGISPAGETNEFAAALVQSATLLRTEGYAATDEGEQLVAALRALLDEVTGRAPLLPPRASRTR